MRHSVAMDLKKCLGCTTCVKDCPTEAIRVRSGKAAIIPDRCIDCGSCIRVCPHKSVKAVCDSFSLMQNYFYNVAVPDPALYGQFHNLDDVDIVLGALLKIGFDDVYEAAAGAELLSALARERIQKDFERPMPEISSACPAVVRLISIRFPRLLSHIAPMVAPTEMAAVLARRKAVEETGLPPEQIGVFSIVPCSSLVTTARAPLGLTAPVLDGAFAIRDVYLALLDPMRKLDRSSLKPLSGAGILGIGYSYVGGESAGRLRERYVAVDGMDNVIRTLEDLEDGRLPDADFVELRACTQGCMGGCLTVENPFAARMRVKRLTGGMPVSRSGNVPDEAARNVLRQAQRPEYLPALQLDPDRRQAMMKLLQIQDLEKHLPGIGCGSCGAPSCHAFAEDVVMGRASEDDCIFQVRKRMRLMTGSFTDDYLLPAPFRRQQAGSGGQNE